MTNCELDGGEGARGVLEYPHSRGLAKYMNMTKSMMVEGGRVCMSG
jgi:hypothetical protein